MNLHSRTITPLLCVSALAVALLVVATSASSEEGKRLTRPPSETSAPATEAATTTTTGAATADPSGATITVFVDGVKGSLRDNVAAFLTINQPPPERRELSSSEGGLVETSLDGIISGAKKIAGGEEEDELPKDAQGLKAVGHFELQVDERRLKWLHSRAEQEIRAALQPFGYYQPTVDSRLDRSGKNWIAYYIIDRGPPVIIDQVNLRVLGEGAADPAFQKLLRDAPFKPGATLVQPPFEELKNQLQLMATERGYFDADLKAHEIRIDLQANRADVELIYDAGQRYRFGEVTFTDGILSRELLERFLKFAPGDPYSSEQLQTLQSDLINSEHFARVEIDAPFREAVDRRVPVRVELEARDRRHLSFGFGYGTDTGFRGTAGYQLRRLNKHGHQLNGRLLLSEIKYNVVGTYEIPGSQPATDAIVLRTGVFREDSDVKDSLTFVIGVNWRTQREIWKRTLSLDYGYESFRVDDRNESKLLVPGITLTRIDADDPVNITRGNRLDLRLRGSYELLVSDQSFLQPVARGKLIQPLWGFGTLTVRGDFGTTLVDDFEQFPTSLRFYAGGDNSVRGYELDKIGPEDSQGNVTGGKSLIVGSVEYEHRLFGQWSGAAFVDTGDAFNFDQPDLKTGVGVGVRWRSPIGPVSLDFAHALDRPPGDDIRLHFSFGPPL